MVHCYGGGKARTRASHISYQESGIAADQAVKRLNKIRGWVIQSNDQERMVFNYEKFYQQIGQEDRRRRRRITNQGLALDYSESYTTFITSDI
jgi:hypothetical protein